MRLYNIYGKLQKKNVRPYLIDWDGKSRSKIQFSVKQFLKTFWKTQMVYEEFPVYGTKMKVDILNATKKIPIEVNGGQHNSFNKFFHANSRANYLKSIKRDMEKSEWLEKNDFTLVEIEEAEVKNISKEFFKSKFGITL